MTEQDIIKDYRKTKNIKLLGQLYQPYMPLIFGSCLKYFKDEMKAEDAVMDIFEKVAKKLLLSEVSHFNAWIYTVTRNHCLETLRKENRLQQKENEFERMQLVQNFHPDEVDNKEEKYARLDYCIEKLESQQQECIMRFYYKKMSYQEIAGQLQISYNQVRSNIQNGRRNIKNCLVMKKWIT